MSNNNLEQLVDIIKEKDSNKALDWIKKAGSKVNYSEFRNEFNQTIPQICIQPNIDMGTVAIKVIKRMDKDSLENVDNFKKSLITSSIFYYQILDLLLKKGVNPETRDENGITLVAKIAERGFIKRLKQLVKNFKVDINDKKADSALILASRNNKDEAVKFLLEENVDLEEEFISKYGNYYSKYLKEYKRLNEYTEFLVKAQIIDLYPDELKDIFVF